MKTISRLPKFVWFVIFRLLTVWDRKMFINVWKFFIYFFFFLILIREGVPPRICNRLNRLLHREKKKKILWPGLESTVSIEILKSLKVIGWEDSGKKSSSLEGVIRINDLAKVLVLFLSNLTANGFECSKTTCFLQIMF